jgi:hypothetical protein
MGLILFEQYILSGGDVYNKLLVVQIMFLDFLTLKMKAIRSFEMSVTVY